MAQPYIGEIRLFAGTYAPDGWLLCQGQTISIADNEVLFTLLGTTYGGDGQTNFNLPNLQDTLPVGQGQGLGLTNRVIGQQIGVDSVTLTPNQIPSHTHTVNATAADAVDQIKAITSGGVDYAFDTVSIDKTQALAFDALAPGGHSVAVGISAATVKAQYSPFMMVFTEKKVSGTFYGSVRPDLDFPVLVDHYMNKKLNLDGLISRTYRLEEINDGFKRMMAGEVARGVVVFD